MNPVPAGPASAVIAAEIRRRGPIPFREYMALALYHPEVGYYCRPEPRIGPEGDYYTSPDLHAEFGACLGRQCAECWRHLGEPPAFDLVELGGGKGLLARDLLRWAASDDPAFAAALLYTSVDVSPAMRALQAQRLAAAEIGPDLARRVRWVDSHDLASGSIVGCMVANEFFDALPIHRVVGAGSVWKELHVGTDFDEQGSRFVELALPLASSDLRAYLDDSDHQPASGRRLDLAIDAAAAVRRVASFLHRGYLFAIDYGGPSPAGEPSARRVGGLRTFRRHTVGRDPYVAPGAWDMTLDVDFAALSGVGVAAGLRVAGYTRQAEFLAALGIGDRLRRALEDSATGLADYRSERRAIEALVHPAGLGAFRVLALARAAPTDGLTGFAWRNDRALLGPPGRPPTPLPPAP